MLFILKKRKKGGGVVIYTRKGIEYEELSLKNLWASQKPLGDRDRGSKGGAL